MTREEADAMTNEEVFAYRELHHEHRRATSTLYEAKLEVLKDQQSNMLQEMVSFPNWIQAEMDNEITQDEEAQFRKRWLVKTDYGQGFLCQLCGKETWGGPGCQHLKSSSHQEKEREEILLDRIFGAHEPTKAAVRNYWGPNMENLITILEMKMRCGEEISFKYGKSQKAASYVISRESEYRFHLALIHRMLQE